MTRIRPVRFPTRAAAAVLLLAATLATAACGGKINAENFGKLATGMSQKDAEAILGPGSETGSASVAVPAVPNMPAAATTAVAGTVGAPGSNVTTKVVTWRSGNRVITVTFVNDKLVSKAQVGL